MLCDWTAQIWMEDKINDIKVNHFMFAGAPLSAHKRHGCLSSDHVLGNRQYPEKKTCP